MKLYKVGTVSEEEIIRGVADILLSGGVAVFPTDTVYGIAAHPKYPDAIGRIYEIKGRPDGKPIAFLASDCDAPKRFGASMPPVAIRNAKRFWPGALTLVLDCGETTEGFRIPDNDLTRKIIAACGGLLRVTSANLSGTPALAEITDAMGPVCEKCDAVVDGGRCPGGVASTVARITATGEVSILRQGEALLEY